MILEKGGRALILQAIMNKNVKENLKKSKNKKSEINKIYFDENVANVRKIIISEHFAVLEFENEVLAIFGNDLYQFKEKFIKKSRKNSAEYAKEIMRGYFSEYFLSFDLKKDKKLYEFYFNKKIKPLLEQQ